MKKIIALLLLLVTTLTFAQVQKLGELSSGRFIDSRIIYEDHTDDVYGYFLLYENDRKSKEIYELEYVILDKNLNKVTSNTFIQGIYKTILTKTDAVFSFVKKIDSDILFGLQDRAENTNILFSDRYRKLSLTDFKLSDEIVIIDLKPQERKYEIGDKIVGKVLLQNQKLIRTNGNYFLVFGIPEYNPGIYFAKTQDKVDSSIKKFVVFDKNLNVVKENQINLDENSKSIYTFFDSDKDVFLMGRRKLKSKAIDYISIFDYNNGLIAEFSTTDTNYNFTVDEVEFTQNTIVLYARLFNKKDKERTEVKSLGYSKIVLDKKTGKELKKDYLLWKDFGSHLVTKGGFGEIPKYGKIYVQDFVHLQNGNSIIIAEGFKTKKKSEILDLFVLELDSDFKIKYFKKTDKNKTTLQFEADGSYLKWRGAFDYLYSQKLDNDGNYVFFYANNEKEGGKRTKRKNPEWVLGIVTYVDGEFNYDKLQLSKKDSQIIPGKAKNGYIRLLEIEDKEIELRLEKINY